MLCLGAAAALGAAPGPLNAPPSAEAQLALTSLRPGERVRAERVLGALELLPLYQAELEVDPSARKVTGTLLVRQVVAGKPLREVSLRLTPNAFGNGNRVRLTKVRMGTETLVPERVGRDLLRMALKTPVLPGDSVTLDVRFTAEVPALPRGHSTFDLQNFQRLARPSAGAGAAQTDHGAFSASSAGLSLVGILPSLPALDALGRPSAGPAGFGDLALYAPANYLVSVHAPAGYTVLAPGSALGEVPTADGGTRFTFGHGASRDFPIFVLRDVAVQERRMGEVNVQVWSPKRDAGEAKRLLSDAVDSLKALEAHLGPYPYTSFRVVAAPLTDGAGGMEFPGLVTLSNDLVSSARDPVAGLGLPPQLAAMVQGSNAQGLLGALGGELSGVLDFALAHEAAHQYFAGLVGSDPILEPVVDEALAQYVALLVLEWRGKTDQAQRLRSMQVAGSFQMYRMMGGKDGAADRPTPAFASALEYAALVYGKAALLHEAERKLLGDADFVRGLRTYVDRNRYGWAHRESLTQALASIRPDKARALEQLRQRWWNEAHGDEDLGTLDLGGLMPGLSGGKTGDLPAEVKALLEQLEGE